MLFMGEEWAASTPWQFFTSHPEPELGKATAEGRLQEFARMGWDPDLVPDPQDPQTFQRSKLDWSEADAAITRGCWRSTGPLLQLRSANPTSPRPAGRTPSNTARRSGGCPSAAVRWPSC